MGKTEQVKMESEMDEEIEEAEYDDEAEMSAEEDVEKPVIALKLDSAENVKDIISDLLSNSAVISWAKKIGWTKFEIGEEAENRSKAFSVAKTGFPVTMLSPDNTTMFIGNAELPTEMRTCSVNIEKLREMLSVIPSKAEGRFVFAKKDFPAFFEIRQTKDGQKTKHDIIVIAPCT